MTRIFVALAGLAVLLLCVNIVLGLRIGDYNGQFARQSETLAEVQQIEQGIEELKQQRPRPRERIDALREQKQSALQTSKEEFAPIRSRAFVHMMFGIVAALVTLLVNSICVTYFIGTSRWVREVVETYGFPQVLIAESNALKRRTFPWALTGMLTVVGIIALGQAANPGIIREGTAFWVTPHLVGAMLGTALIAYAFYRQGQNIARNYELIGQIVARVEEIRRERGLDVEAEQPDAERAIQPEFYNTVTK